MLKVRKILSLLFLIIGISSGAFAESINASAGPSFQANHYVFGDKTNNIVGFARLNNGFTVMPQSATSSILTFTGCVPVAGAIDLRETSTLHLAKDIKFDNSVTLSSGGNIYGNNKSIILSGNLTIPAGKVIHFSSGGSYATGPGGGTAIRGNGNTITIDNWGQIFVDTNTTLTISNATIRFNKGNNPGKTPIKLAAHNSKLALDNVTLDLTTGGDFYFTQGQLYIHNDVMVTGTSAFIYTSPIPSWITSGGTFYFDQGTTFSVAPSTYTDAPFTLKNTYTDCNFIKMADKTSTLYFNGCSLKNTATGLRLSKGATLFDNAVSLDTITTNSLAPTPCTQITSLTGNTDPYSLSWSPDGKYIAVVNEGGTYYLQIYSFDGTNLAALTNVSITAGKPHTVAWSPDGRFIAVGVNTGTNGLTVYAFNGSSAPTVVKTINITSEVSSLSWSPDGKYIATVSFSGSYIAVYVFDGKDLRELGKISSQTQARYVDWSAQGKFISIVTYSSAVKIFSFTGGSLTAGPTYTQSNAQCTGWSPDARFVATIDQGNKVVKSYRFDGTQLILLGTSSPLLGSCSTVSWSPDGKYIVVACDGAVTLLFFDKTGAARKAGPPIYVSGSIFMDAKFSPNGKFIASINSNNEKLYVFGLNYIVDPTPQPLRNSIIFGDSAKGADYDASLNFLSSAQAKVTGKILIDNVEE
jgi:WD40 repeat protein